jgi:hypothetical protein
MAKYRCPICGANHKDPVHQCRLCGAVMDDTVDHAGAVALRARPTTEKKKGLAGFALVGVITVAVILLLAIVMGFTTGDLSVAKVRDKIPFLRTTSDGWMKVDDPEGGFTVEMPSSRQTTSAVFEAATNGRLTGWTATIGSETTLVVLYGKVAMQPDETSTAALQRLVDKDVSDTKAAAGTRQVKLEKQTETNFRGYPAIEYEISGRDVYGKYGYEKAIVFMKGDEFYSLASLSIYQDHPQFDRFQSSFEFAA